MSEDTEVTTEEIASTPEPAGTLDFWEPAKITAKDLAATLGFLRKELGAVHSFTSEEIHQILGLAFHHIVNGQITHNPEEQQ